MSAVCTIFALMKTIPILPDVTLRELRADDTAEIFAAIDNERAYLGRWLPFVQFTRSEEDTQRFVRSVLDAPYREAVFTIRDGGRFIGLIGFKSTDPLARTTEIGYWLREAWQGRGIVTTAVAALCRMAREELAMRTVTIKCATGNGPSQPHSAEARLHARTHRAAGRTPRKRPLHRRKRLSARSCRAHGAGRRRRHPQTVL